MKILGIIAEYNPFHNGHIYHIEKAKELTEAEATIVLMSGNFVQRGEPAIIDKWRRAKIAVLNGVDLVIELPFIYSSQTAEIFSDGSIRILNSLNSIDYIGFGSEARNLNTIEKIVNILIENPKEYNLLLKERLEKGYNYPNAREYALSNIVEGIENIISKPNNILAIEYIKALKKINSSIRPINIIRKDNHNSDIINSEISSATAIRKTLLDSQKLNINSIKKTIPNSTIEELNSFILDQKKFISKEELHNIFLFNIIRSDLKDDIFELNPSLINRIKNSLYLNQDIRDIIDNIYTKNYTSTRINRVILNTIMDLKKDDMMEFKEYSPRYIRILASNNKGFKIINEIKKNSDINIINTYSKKDHLNRLDRKIIEYDERATDLYYFLLSKNTGKLMTKMDYKKSPFIIK
ncbi:MAG: nucleotidyltransferase [Andreesenia angusta]|nr:nucleotidyltransferase [Andreesenia angusta]